MSSVRPPRLNWPHDPPSPIELIEAVRDHLSAGSGSGTGRDRWMNRISANALTVALRELESGEADGEAHSERLRLLGVDDEGELSAAIREGRLDPRREELARALWATTLDKLAVANPGYRDRSNEPPCINSPESTADREETPD